jgi:uncharacterized protein YndB with AHSA1/START domain
MGKAMSHDAQFTHAHMVRFERRIDASPEAIWAVLTDAARLPGWYGADGLIEGRVGGSVRLMGGHIRGVVTQWQPARKLAYTWNVFAPGEAESKYPESYLTLELDGAALTLAHLPVLEAFVKLNAMGWHTFLDMVDATARGATPELREAYMKRNAARYGVDISKLPA